mmetsp:Transcript_115439/g.361091  ORF Transcript_115439/g.361091 Transcript_115439/m.361091 type:complete len:201 (-) Transcript_115439:46-648(-)
MRCIQRWQRDENARFTPCWRSPRTEGQPNSMRGCASLADDPMSSSWQVLRPQAAASGTCSPCSASAANVGFLDFSKRLLRAASRTQPTRSSCSASSASCLHTPVCCSAASSRCFANSAVTCSPCLLSTSTCPWSLQNDSSNSMQCWPTSMACALPVARLTSKWFAIPPTQVSSAWSSRNFHLGKLMIRYLYVCGSRCMFM